MEKTIEKYFCKKVKEIGGVPLKLTSPSMNGLPDRIVLLPFGLIFFAELKDRGCSPRPDQLAIHRILRSLGFKVYVIDCKEESDKVVNEWSTHLTNTKNSLSTLN